MPSLVAHEKWYNIQFLREYSLALSNALNYFYAFRSKHLPLNLIQAQRDLFGSHNYERKDKLGIFHSDWD